MKKTIVAGFADLRTLKPSQNGQSVSLAGWEKGSSVGGGEFIGHYGNEVDDGGVIASGDGFWWQRNMNPDQLDVTHFGALTGTTSSTDCINAVECMFAWSQKNYPSIGVQFPSGSFYLSSWDISETYYSYFRFIGAGSNKACGQFSNTILNSDKVGLYILSVNARRTEISGFEINGEYNTIANTQGFFNNICQEGQYGHFFNLRLTYMGGVGLNLMDTLDCQIKEFYGSNNYDSEIRCRYSDIKSWDHCTAVKIVDGHILKNNGVNACIDAPRTTQSMIENFWLESIYNAPPMDINNGDWSWFKVSVEDCNIAINAQSCSLIEEGTNFQGPSSLDDSVSATAWLSGWEHGRTRLQATGTNIHGFFAADIVTSRTVMDNQGSKSAWFKVGRAYIGLINEELEIEILGTRGFNSLPVSMVTINGGGDARGLTKIAIQRVDLNKFKVTASFEGSPCISSVKYTVNESYVTVYVLIDNYTRNAAVFARTNGPNRFTSGAWAQWVPAGTVLSEEPMGTLAQNRVSVHNQLAGIGANEDGNLVAKTHAVAITALDGYSIAGMMQIVINGSLHYVPYYKAAEI